MDNENFDSSFKISSSDSLIVSDLLKDFLDSLNNRDITFIEVTINYKKS